MNCLSDIRDLLKNKNLEITSFDGIKLKTTMGIFTMAFDVVYLDGVVIDKKDLQRKINEIHSSTRSN